MFMSSGCWFVPSFFFWNSYYARCCASIVDTVVIWTVPALRDTGVWMGGGNNKPTYWVLLVESMEPQGDEWLSWPPSVLMMETEALRGYKYHRVLGYSNRDRVLTTPFLLPQRVLRHWLRQSVWFFVWPSCSVAFYESWELVKTNPFI